MKGNFMRELITFTFLFVILSGCQASEKVSLDKIHWETGSFADLNKKPVSVILTNSEPNLFIAHTLYQQDFSKRASQIVHLIQTGVQEQEDVSELPFFYLPEQLWIAFEDGTGSVFPFYFDAHSSCIRASEGIHYSDGLAELMEWIRFCQIEHQPPSKIEFEKVKWKRGVFTDLKKEAIGIVISYKDSHTINDSDSELNFDFKESELDDVSEEAARIAYLLGYNKTAEEFQSDRPLTQKMWIAFKDGTGSVFDCYEQAYSDCYIRSGNIARRSPQANAVLYMIRRYPYLRQQIRDGKKPPCSELDMIESN